MLARLAARASCRAFDGSPITPDELEAIVTDGLQAPSSCNHQNWHFVLVTDQARKDRAREVAGGNPHFSDCAALVYLCFQKGWTHGNFSIVQSVAGACYHMMLSAHLRGWRCIWNAGIGDHAALRDMLGLPQTFEVQGALAIGKPLPDAPPMKAPRRPPAEVMSWERFDRPAHAVYPAKPADAYPFFAIRNDDNPYAEWNPARWTWAQVADFRGYSVWAKSPLAGVYVSRRQGDALAREHGLLPDLAPGAKAIEVMPWGGTTTAELVRRLPGVRLTVAELSEHNVTFIRERLRQEGLGDTARFAVMADGRLPMEDGVSDLVVLPQVLEHAPDPRRLLGEAARVLKPGGWLVASLRNADSAYGAHWREVESRAQVPNQGPFTPLPAATVRSWVAERFAIEAELGIGREAVGDAAPVTGDDLLKGRLWAVRARRD
ncbi:methyltransferase domain-containing protein [Rhodovulum sp. 12E13]|nr:methyltransferase domain-containing protein [Rhodovulum sp. 12E13]